ncbi:MAG: amidophosphoribosyltransferase [Planctomycetes bacterium]|nr:amidophosphoribosyltransferase [Planctomycetota bacterium]
MATAREACGLFGLWGDPEAAAKTYYGLFALQHRGQESAGITTGDGVRLTRHRGMGTLPNAFSDPGALERLRNPHAIGHVRYSTTGSSLIQNAQPLTANTQWGPLAAAHNGNLVNAAELRARFEASGSIFQTTSDSEVILHLLASATESDPLDRIVAMCRQLKGAFSLLILTREGIYAIRDRQGMRPLWIGQTEEGAYAFASETPAFDLTHVTAMRELAPGTVAVADNKGLREVRFAEAEEKHCVFEHVYFARPDGELFGDPVQLMRRAFGRALAREHPVEADVVIAIPDSGNAAARGYSLESGIPLEEGFIRNHYVGRTFIEPDPANRTLHADLKLNVVRWNVAGKRVVVVDDSVVRGTTAKRRCEYVRLAGATEVHLRISCPPIRHPCFYGVDFQSKGELIAANADMAEITRRLGVDTMGYLSVEGMLAELSKPKDSYCTACWTGNYPIPIPEGTGKKSCGEELQTLVEG